MNKELPEGTIKTTVRQITITKNGKSMTFSFPVRPDVFDEADTMIAVLREAIVEIDKLKGELAGVFINTASSEVGPQGEA